MGDYFFGITDKGKRREKNEDNFIAQELPAAKLQLACVIDGVGGYSGGEVAAAIARSVILEHFEAFVGDITSTLYTAVVAANTRIRQEKKKSSETEQMACVLTCAVTDTKNNKLYYAHVGDTRLYLLRDLSLVKLTKDHSVVGFLEESGRLSEEDAMRHPRRNEITRALGFEENINTITGFIETGESPFLPGDSILLCSDGLSDMVPSNAILAILLNKNSLAENALELVNAANEAGGDDNITAVLVKNCNQPVPKIALKPADKKTDNSTNPLYIAKEPVKEKIKLPLKHNRTLTPFLALLLFGILAILLFQKNTSPAEKNMKPKILMGKPKTTALSQLPGNIHDSVKVLILPPATHLLLDSQININKDSFYLKGNGATISPGSNYKGPAMLIGNTARQIILDSLVFKNFDVAVIVWKNNIQLKNVRFINCRVPVQYQVLFTDTTISGRFKDSIFIPVKTLKKP